MKEKISSYKERLENELSEYLELPVNQRSADAVSHMIECWEQVGKMEKALSVCRNPQISEDDIKLWNKAMKNADGTVGGHWAVEQTTPLATSAGVDFEKIDPISWNVTVNMMYSDYSTVAAKYAANKPDFYAALAKAFLFDEDGGEPRRKLAAYYQHIARG